MADHAELMRDIIASLKASSSVLPNSLDWTNLPGKPVAKPSSRLSTQELIDSIESSICTIQGALREGPKNHLEKAKLLNILGFELGRRYSYQRFSNRTLRRKYSETDLTGSIQAIQEAVDMTPTSDSSRAEMHYNLSVQLYKVYVKTKDFEDLNEVIRVARAAVHQESTKQAEFPCWSIHLADRLYTRYARMGKMCDLDEAIETTQKAINGSMPGTIQARLQEMLGDFIRERVARTSDVVDLDEAIVLARNLSRSAPIVFRGGRLMQLSNLLQKKYSRTGDMSCLDEAIQTMQEAVDEIESDFPLGVDRLNLLGNLLGDRYARVGAMIDLNDAVNFNQKALEASSIQDQGWIGFSNDYGAALGERYARKGQLTDLEEAIRVTTAALQGLGENADTSVQGYCSRALLSANLGKYLGCQYARSHQITHLEDAIQAHRKSIETFPEGEDFLGRVGRLGNLASLLGTRFRRPGEMSDIEEAISIAREGMHIMQENHPDCGQLLQILGELLEDRFAKSQVSTDFEEASSCYKPALYQQNAPVLNRIIAGKEALECAASGSDWEQAYEDSKIAVQLIPKLTARSLEQSDKQHILGQIVNLACSATAMALQANKSPATALCLLELGRGVLAASVDEMRADVLEIQEKLPELAEQFIRFRDELEQFGRQPATLSIESATEARATRRYTTGIELEEVIVKIRNSPGFETFLLPPQKHEMQAAAKYGPIVVINVSVYRCDVLLLENCQIRCIHLPDLKLEDIKAKVIRGDFGSIEVLAWLWHSVSKPTLDALGFTVPGISLCLRYR